MRPTSEIALVYQILDYLELCGVTAWRQNTGGRTDPDQAGGERYTQFGIPGVSDILGLLPDGRFLAIEVKLPGNAPTSRQWEFLLTIQRSRGVALWVDCFEAIEHALPKILAGAWVTTGPDHAQVITDEWTTGPTLGPPTRAVRRRSRPASKT